MGRVWSTARHEDDLTSSDARIIEGLRRGAPAAFAGLHERYAAGIYSLALRVVRHAPDAEDITQDVLLRAFERLPKDREVLLRPWLYRLTLNRCYDYLRVSARRPPPASPGHEAVSPHDPYEQSELQGLLEAAIGDLTRRQQAALLLKDVHGLSLTEVAACLELTPGSVEVLLARARRAFRASFEERCTAAGRPLPRSAGVLAALPIVPLPAGLAAFAVPPAPPAPCVPLPLVAPPLSLAAGSGIGAVLGLPASLKSAVLIAAAAATVGTAEIAVTRADHRPPRPSAGAAAVIASPAATVAVRSTAHATPTPDPSTPSPSPSGEPLPSPASTVVVEPSPQGSPLGITTPSATPEPSATPSETPTAHATTPPASPSASPSPSATPEPGGSPSPSASPDPAFSPSP